MIHHLSDVHVDSYCFMGNCKTVIVTQHRQQVLILYIVTSLINFAWITIYIIQLVHTNLTAYVCISTKTKKNNENLDALSHFVEIAPRILIMAQNGV